MNLKTIETEFWEPVPDKPGMVRYAGQRKSNEIFNELKAALEKAGLLPDEYFTMNPNFPAVFPRGNIRCYAQWGGSEGVYFEIEVCFETISGIGVKEPVRFASGKTLERSALAYDKMQYIAGICYKLLAGASFSSCRYTENQANDKKVLEALEYDMRQFLLEYSFANDELSLITHSEDLLLCADLIERFKNGSIELTTEQRLSVLNSAEPLAALKNVVSANRCIKTLCIDADDAENYQALMLAGANTEGFSRYATIQSWTVDFGEGYEADLKVCSSDIGDPLWSEAVLFFNGAEVSCSEPRSELCGEWLLHADGREFVVNVVTTPVHELLIKFVCNDTVENIEDFLGYPISANVLEGLEDRMREVLSQMPDEELTRYKERYGIKEN